MPTIVNVVLSSNKSKCQIITSQRVAKIKCSAKCNSKLVQVHCVSVMMLQTLAARRKVLIVKILDLFNELLHKYIHQPYQTSSFHITSVTSHMILKVTKMIFKQIFTCFKLLISKTKNTLNLRFFVLAYKKFRSQTPFSLPYGRSTVPSPQAYGLLYCLLYCLLLDSLYKLSF